MIPTMRQILIAHASRYPRWGIEDVYKLIHQAALGSEHAAADEAGARASLDQEMAALGPGPDEPLTDPIAPDGAVVRVHLRPFVRLGHDPELLLAAFLRTAREFRGSAARLAEYGESAAELAREGVLSLSATGLASLIARMRTAGFPALRHSANFRAEYRPAYRVVARSFLDHTVV